MQWRYWSLFREQPANEDELSGQMLSEIYGSTGGVCGLRCDTGQQSEDPQSAGFRYDDNDKCWRCDGISVFGPASFVNNCEPFMLPPFSMNNDSSWTLGPAYVELLPVELHVGNYSFRLAGVVLHGKDHFTSLILAGNRWHYYDGLHGEGELARIDSANMKQLPLSLCNAYYLVK